MPEFKNLFEKLDTTFKTAAGKSKADDYIRLSSMMSDLDILLREYLQDETSTDIKKIIDKLKDHTPLNAQEVKQVKLWIVGDAEYYTKLENNFEDWRQELNRLIKEISRYAKNDPDIETAMTLRGLLRDGINLLAEINFFLEQKERVSKFETNIGQLDEEDRAALIEVLQQKLKSWDF